MSLSSWFTKNMVSNVRRFTNFHLRSSHTKMSLKHNRKMFAFAYKYLKLTFSTYLLFYNVVNLRQVLNDLNNNTLCYLKSK